MRLFAKMHAEHHAANSYFNTVIKGDVCRILTLLKHKNTIIYVQIFKKHAKLTYRFI